MTDIEELWQQLESTLNESHGCCYPSDEDALYSKEEFDELKQKIIDFYTTNSSSDTEWRHIVYSRCTYNLEEDVQRFIDFINENLPMGNYSKIFMRQPFRFERHLYSDGLFAYTLAARFSLHDYKSNAPSDGSEPEDFIEETMCLK